MSSSEESASTPRGVVRESLTAPLQRSSSSEKQPGGRETLIDRADTAITMTSISFFVFFFSSRQLILCQKKQQQLLALLPGRQPGLCPAPTQPETARIWKHSNDVASMR